MKPGNFPEFPMSLEFYSGWILLLEGNADRFEWSVVKFVRIFLYLSFNVSFNVFILAFTQNFSFALEPSWTGNQEVIFHYFSPVLQNQCVQNIQKYSPIVFFFFFFLLHVIGEWEELVEINSFITFITCVQNFPCVFSSFYFYLFIY